MKSFFRSDFTKNIITLLSGSVIAQAIPLAIMPLLSRIYSPEDFGILAVFLSFTAVLGAIANARYEMAVVLPKSEKEALALVVLGVLISSALSVVLLVIVWCCNDWIARLVNTPGIAGWLYWVPLSVFFIGIFNVLNYYNTRIKKYKDIATSNVFKSVALSVVNIVLGFLKEGPAGLIWGQIASFFFGNYRLAKPLMKQKENLLSVTRSDIKQVAKRYERFPKLSMPSIFANVASVNLFNVVTPVLFSVKTLGFYAMANRILGFPTALIGKAFGQVYMQEASEQRKQTGEAQAVFKSTLYKLLLISIPSFGLLFFVVEDLFAFVLGEKWRIAGVYARILIPLFWARFVSAPLSLTNIVFEKQHIALWWQTGLLVISIVVFAVVYYWDLMFNTFLYLYAGILFLYYVYLLFILNKVAKGQ